jgi:elongation factor Ts
MAEITAALVKELREKTGVGMMDCKKALEENDGNMEAATDWLRTQGLAGAQKRAGRSADQGAIDVLVEGGVGAVVELTAETDFVAKGAIGSYVHNAIAPGLGKIGVLVAIEGEGDQNQLAELGRKIAMHVAATSPLSLSSDDLDPAAIERERAVLTEKAREEGKPDNMIDKIVSGQISKFQREVVLMEQAFVMNPDQTVKQLVEESAKALGPLKVTGFVRLALGEGVEKKADDFAAEVASMTGGS